MSSVFDFNGVVGVSMNRAPPLTRSGGRMGGGGGDWEEKKGKKTKRRKEKKTEKKKKKKKNVLPRKMFYKIRLLQH